MSFVNWVIDSLASEDVIDLYFILSDLVDIELTEAEIAENVHYLMLYPMQPQGKEILSVISLWGKQVY